ncbi:hypothetical protein G3435_26195 [Pseudomonas sp. MAFF212428]|uniref:Uncharacterized protein n=1 Tax=Pseudomonas brassicae TaxID=2708063 RepID=A0A6M0D0Z3_9PSED|nr:hypothetical protein [Pseudomonas brassicae]
MPTAGQAAKAGHFEGLEHALRGVDPRLALAFEYRLERVEAHGLGFGALALAAHAACGIEPGQHAQEHQQGEQIEHRTHPAYPPNRCAWLV